MEVQCWCCWLVFVQESRPLVVGCGHLVFDKGAHGVGPRRSHQRLQIESHQLIQVNTWTMTTVHHKMIKVVSFKTFPCGTTPLFVGANVGVTTELWYARNVAPRRRILPDDMDMVGRILVCQECGPRRRILPDDMDMVGRIQYNCTDIPEHQISIV